MGKSELKGFFSPQEVFVHTDISVSVIFLDHVMITTFILL